METTDTPDVTPEMVSHWRNSNHQIDRFILGDCNTPDEAYRKAVQQASERKLAIETANASKLKSESRQLLWEFIKILGYLFYFLWPIGKIITLRAKGEIMEAKAHEEEAKACYFDAMRELEHWKLRISQLESMRKYKDLPHHEAHQRIQGEEWALEAKRRVENYLISQDTGIPADQIEMMRMLPESKELFGYLEQVRGRAIPLTYAMELREPLGEKLKVLPTGTTNNLLASPDNDVTPKP